MQSIRLFIAAMVVATLFGFHDASALSVDTTTGTNSDGSSRFADPEDEAAARLGISDNQDANQNDAHGAPSVNFNLNPTGDNGPRLFTQPYNVQKRTN